MLKLLKPIRLLISRDGSMRMCDLGIILQLQAALAFISYWTLSCLTCIYLQAPSARDMWGLWSLQQLTQPLVNVKKCGIKPSPRPQAVLPVKSLASPLVCCLPQLCLLTQAYRATGRFCLSATEITNVPDSVPHQVIPSGRGDKAADFLSLPCPNWTTMLTKPGMEVGAAPGKGVVHSHCSSWTAVLLMKCVCAFE